MDKKRAFITKFDIHVEMYLYLDRIVKKQNNAKSKIRNKRF